MQLFVSEQKIVSTTKDPLHQSPAEESQSSAMPETGNSKNDKDIQILSNLSLPVAAQRDVKVISKPACQRYVPAGPEFPVRL